MEHNSYYDRIRFEDDRLPICIHYDQGLVHLHPQREPFSWHEQIELLYVRRGQIAVYCSAQPFYARAGELVVINPNQIHRVEHEGGEVGYDCLMVDPSLYRSREEGICEERYFDPLEENRLCFENRIKEDEAVFLCVEELCRECREKAPGYELAVKARVFELFSCLFRKHLSQRGPLTQMLQNADQYRRIRPAMEYMQANLSRPLRLGELARSCNLSEAHFCRLFRQITSLPPMQYLAQLRLDRAAQLLKTQDKTVSEIAWETGFEEASYLSRRFKEHYGLTPRQLRNRCRRS